MRVVERIRDAVSATRGNMPRLKGRRDRWIEAHDQKLTIRLLMHVPAHGPRGVAFERAKRRMKRLGLNQCVVPGCDTGAPIEYHHRFVEHAWWRGFVVWKVNRVFGLHLSDAEFEEWVQSPGNLEPLCVVHHRTQLGVHALPEPLWNAVRCWDTSLPPPAEQLPKGQP